MLNVSGFCSVVTAIQGTFVDSANAIGATDGTFGYHSSAHATDEIALFRGFGLSVPAASAVVGIEVTMRCYGDFLGSGARNLCLGNRDTAISANYLLPSLSSAAPGADVVVGGPADGWGVLGLLSPAFVSSSDFAIHLTSSADEFSSQLRTFVDSMLVRVYYTPLSRLSSAAVRQGSLHHHGRLASRMLGRRVGR